MGSSKHFAKRCKERMGLSKKAVDSLLSRALKEGKGADYYKNKHALYSYLDSLLYDTDRKDLVIYNHYIIIYGTNTKHEYVGITVLNLPKQFHYIVDLDKKGDKNGCNRNERQIKRKRSRSEVDDYC